MTRFDEKWAQHLIISEGGRQREVYLESIVPALRESGAQTTLFRRLLRAAHAGCRDGAGAGRPIDR